MLPFFPLLTILFAVVKLGSVCFYAYLKVKNGEME